MNSHPKKSNHWHLASLILLPFFLSACGGSSSDSDPRINISTNANTNSSASTADTSTPYIINTTPQNSAINVLRNNSLTANFSEDIFAITVDSASFTLSESSASNTPSSVQFNGASNVATLTPNRPLAPLTNYTATLSSAITDLSGNALPHSYSWSFTTIDATWRTPALIETDNTGNADNPQIAFDRNDNAITVWQQNDGIRNNIWANQFNGTTWDGAILIETDNTGSAFNPQIAISNNGNAIAVWYQNDGTRNNIWANQFNGTTWNGAILIETDNTGSAFNPQIAISNNGNAIAVWYQHDGIRNNIWINQFDGTNWGAAMPIEGDDTGGTSNPQIAFDNNGNAFAVWQQSDGTRNNIWANRFNGTTWDGATLIEADDTGNASNPQIAFDNNGNAIAVWQQFDGTRNNIWANQFNGTTWGGATLIETDNAGGVHKAQIAIDNNGNAIAVWYQDTGSQYNILASQFDGTTWGTATLLETDNNGAAINPQIAFDSNNNAIAIWYQEDDFPRNNIWTNRFDGTDWGTAVLLETNDAGSATNPQVAFDSNGNAIAVWQQSDGSTQSIWANRFE